jgi:tripartite-type tricarboxylate transporter receptor subunit TctC
LISSPAALGNPYYAPPGVPSDRLALLSSAFASTLTDPDFIKEAEKIQAEISPMSGSELAGIIDQVVNASADIVARARNAVEVKGGMLR